jgi:transposase
MVVDPGGKLWSITGWCLVPVFQRDFGCCDALIGGGPALKKVRPDPAGESVVSFASRAEPESEIRREEHDMAKRRKSTFERLSTGQMNRSQRRELGRRVAAGDAGLAIVQANAGGIDVGNESHFVAVPPDRDTNPVREFGCWTAALNEMAEWLKSCRIDTVAMQATGVYWIALYDVLEQHGVRVVLVNAQHTKNVPGRKTDVQECQWLMKLHTYGLVRDSFRLQQDMEYVRTIWRVRDRHVKEAGREVQHMQKALTKMNVQLANVISDVSGVSGQAIVTAVLKGERDPYKLADLADYRVKASREEVARSLEGNWRADVLFELQQAVDSYHFAHRQMRECDEKLTFYLVSLPTRMLEIPVPSKGAPETPESPAQKRKKAKKPRDNEPRMDMKGELKRICGVDLTSIDGINVMTAFTVLSEVGTDMARFKDEDHFSSWMGLAPSKDISSGKIVGRGKKKVKNRVAVVLRTAATTLLESDTHLGARYRHLRRQLPTHKAAVKAMARYLAVLIYRLLTKGEAWVDRGARQFEQRRTQREMVSLQTKAKAKGFTLVPLAEAR